MSLCQACDGSARVMYDGRQGLVLEEQSRRILRVIDGCLDITLQSYNRLTLRELERSVGSQLDGLLSEGVGQVRWSRAV